MVCLQKSRNQNPKQPIEDEHDGYKLGQTLVLVQGSAFHRQHNIKQAAKSSEKLVRKHCSFQISRNGLAGLNRRTQSYERFPSVQAQAEQLGAHQERSHCGSKTSLMHLRISSIDPTEWQPSERSIQGQLQIQHKKKLRKMGGIVGRMSFRVFDYYQLKWQWYCADTCR